MVCIECYEFNTEEYINLPNPLIERIEKLEGLLLTSMHLLERVEDSNFVKDVEYNHFLLNANNYFGGK